MILSNVRENDGEFVLFQLLKVCLFGEEGALLGDHSKQIESKTQNRNLSIWKGGKK